MPREPSPRVLQVFNQGGINLTRIESGLTKGKPWEYLFFIDLEGHGADPLVAGIPRPTEGACAFLKLLGSYPQSSP